MRYKYVKRHFAEYGVEETVSHLRCSLPMISRNRAKTLTTDFNHYGQSMRKCAAPNIAKSCH